MHASNARHPQSRAPHFRWSPAQLADAVPPRLSDLFAVGAAKVAPADGPQPRARAADHYLPADVLAPRFRVS